MKKVVLVVGLMLVGIVARGQMLGKGVRELGVGGRLEKDEDVEFSLRCSYGRFITSGIEVGATGSVGIWAGDNRRVSGGAFGEYNIDFGTKVIPFTGLGVEFTWRDFGRDSEVYAALTGSAGGKFFIAENVAFALQLQLWLATSDVYWDGDDWQIYDWASVLTTRFFF